MDFFNRFIWIILIHESYSLTNIYISPGTNVIQGVSVNISCSSDTSRGIIKWRHNDKEVAEDGNPYDKTLFEIQSVGNRYDLIIKNTTLKYRGKWSCKHTADVLKEINLNVSVPWTLKPISTKKIVNKNIEKNLNRNKSFDSIETGQKKFPFSLLFNETLEITCESKCGIPPPKSISVHYENSTQTGELSGGLQRTTACHPDKELHRLTNVIRVNCLSNGLTGRNEILCKFHGENGNIESNKPIFILCSANKNANELTQGEIIAIAVSMVLAIFDIVIIVLLLKQNCRQASTLSQSKTDIIRCPEVML